jgi:type II secretory pathway component PulF
MKLPIEVLFGIYAMIVAGIIVVAVKTVVFWNRWPHKSHSNEFALDILGWSLIFFGSTIFLFAKVNILLGVIWFFLIPCIVVFIYVQNLRMKQRGFLWMLALASEKQIPLKPAIDAYAYEIGGLFGDRVADFSAMLEGGVPLPDALRMAPGLIPVDRYPLICSAYESGALAGGLREAAATRNPLYALWGSLSAKIVYIVGMILFGVSILTFIMIKIIPAFEKIFKDFDAPLPVITRTLVGISHQALLIWPLMALASLLLLFLFVHNLLRFLGVAAFELPGTGWLMRRKHAAEIMDCLAIDVENRRPIDAGLHTLVKCYPSGGVRGKLNRVLADVQAGAPWCESLRARGLISPADAAVLQAAERAGNLPWAMREMADSNRRRLAYRLNVVVQTVFPPVVLCFGAMVMFVVVALFMPLITLIQRMS